MRLLHTVFLAGMIIFTVPVSLAAEAEASCAFSSAAGVKLESFNYRELSESGALIDKETGLLPGLQLGLAADCAQWQYSISAGRQRARLEYDGQTNSGRKLLSRTMENTHEVSAQLGRHFSTGLVNNFDIYAGVGHWQWRREIASVGSVSGLDETYRWRFYYLGGNSAFFQQGANQIMLDIRWLRISRARLSVDFLGVFDKPGDLDLPARNGWRVVIPWQHTLSPVNSIRVEPYAQGWKIRRSGGQPLSRSGVVVGDFFEPASQTRAYGINATWSHLF